MSKKFIITRFGWLNENSISSTVLYSRTTTSVEFPSYLFLDTHTVSSTCRTFVQTKLALSLFQCSSVKMKSCFTLVLSLSTCYFVSQYFSGSCDWVRAAQSDKPILTVFFMIIVHSIIPLTYKHGDILLFNMQKWSEYVFLDNL